MLPSFSFVSWKKSQKIKLTMVCCPFEKIIRFLFCDVLGAVHVREKVFNFTSAHFLLKNVKNPLYVAP